MMRIKRIVLALSFAAGALGGVIFSAHPVSGVLLLFAGLVGTIYSFWSSERRQDKGEAMLAVTAELLIASGAGNPYTKLVQRKLSRPGVHYVIPDLERALGLNPDDADALALYVKIGALHLSFRNIAGVRSRPPGFADPQRLEQLIERGFRTGRCLADFYCAKGVLLDIANRCGEARECFGRSSELSPNPYWRLFACTSYGIEGRYGEALGEIELAISAGAKGPLTDFYYGRCLAAVGEYERAIALFRRVERSRGLFYQLAVSTQEAHYFSWKPLLSAYYEMRASFLVVRISRRKSAQHAIMAARHFAIPLLVFSTQLITRAAKATPLLRKSRLSGLCELDQPYFSLGISVARKRQYAAAKRLFAVAVRKAPLARNCLNLCTAAMLTGDWELAERACLRAMEISPGDSLAYQYLDAIRRKNLGEQIDVGAEPTL